MKKDLHLTASVDKPEVLENIIEELAARRFDIGYGKAKVPATWEAMDTSSVEAFLSGRVEFDYNETHRIRIPYITAFMFCCTKIKNDPYDLTWSISLT